MANYLSECYEPLDPESHYILVALMNDRLLNRSSGLTALRLAKILGPKCNRDLLPYALRSLMERGIIAEQPSKEYSLSADPAAVDAYLYRCDGRLRRAGEVAHLPEWF
tara:strand:- start:599 stop:922 length:324 start_codon:yes stop_codon:yes gene_type:complete